MPKNLNIPLIYVLAYLKTSWFWLGVWVFYYLRFTDYAGIGLIESALIISMTLTEIPTGAVADLLGKKATLALGFLLQTVCNVLMGFAGSLTGLIVAVFFGGLGLTLNSGAYEALIYDSLKETGKENRFDRVIANTNTLTLAAMAVSGSIGGFLYVVDPRLPFFVVGVVYFLAFLTTLFLKEPAIDTEKFSWQSFVKQNQQGLAGLKQLFKVERLAWLIVPVSALYVISDEMLESVLGVEFGFSEQQLGIFFAAVFVVAALLSQLTPIIRKRVGDNKGAVLVTGIMGLSYLLAPIGGRGIGGLSIMVRESASRNLQNFSSVIFNRSIESKYRATTLSTFNMLKNLPYVATAFLLGTLMDLISAKNFAFILGIIVLGLTLTQAGVFIRARRTAQK